MIELLIEAESALSLGMLDRAEILYRQVAGADPRNSIALVGLARVTLERGDEAGALKVARRALAIDPENTAAQRMTQRLEEVLLFRGTPVAPAPPVRVPTPTPPVVPARPEPATPAPVAASGPTPAPGAPSEPATPAPVAPYAVTPAPGEPPLATPPPAGPEAPSPATPAPEEPSGPDPPSGPEPPEARSLVDRLLRRR